MTYRTDTSLSPATHQLRIAKYSPPTRRSLDRRTSSSAGPAAPPSRERGHVVPPTLGTRMVRQEAASPAALAAPSPRARRYLMGGGSPISTVSFRTISSSIHD